MDLTDLNAQALGWCDTVANAKLHATTREVPQYRWVKERLQPLPAVDYDTSYLAHRQVSRDCLVHYRGSRYSVPHRFAGKAVMVREPLGGGQLHIYRQGERIAHHQLSPQSGALMVDPQHYAGLRPKRRWPQSQQAVAGIPLPAGPGIGLEQLAPVVEKRSLRAYEGVADGTAA